MKHKSFPMPDFVHYFRFPVIASLMICASFSVGTGINRLFIGPKESSEEVFREHRSVRT